MSINDEGYKEYIQYNPRDVLEVRIAKAVNLIVRFGGNDGNHHKAWVIDQVARRLLDEDYDRVVKEACAGEDGPNTYAWEVGIAP
jgi:hypothetical protein